MKNKLELVLLGLFTLNSILSFLIGETLSGLGWSAALMVQLRIIKLLNTNKNEQGKI